MSRARMHRWNLLIHSSPLHTVLTLAHLAPREASSTLRLLQDGRGGVLTDDEDGAPEGQGDPSVEEGVSAHRPLQQHRAE